MLLSRTNDRATSSGQAHHAPTDPTEWGVHILPRTGAPPLRFTGRQIYFRSSGNRAHSNTIALWEMRRQGIVLEHSIPTNDGTQRVTLRLASVPEAIEALEAFCKELGGQDPATHAAQPSDMTDALQTFLHHQKRLSQIRDFLNLAGAALATWDGWSPPEFSGQGV